MEKVLARGASSGMAGGDVPTLVTRAAFDVDQGQWSRASTRLDDAMRSAREGMPRHVRMVDAVGLSLASFTKSLEEQRKDLADALAAERSGAPDSGDPVARVDRQRRILLIALLSARNGDVELARQALSMVEPSTTGPDYPELAQRRIIAEAELATALGEPENAIAALLAVCDGSEFYSARVALLTAYTSHGDAVNARVQSTWLLEHRGRAYSEMHGDQMLQLFNVAHSTLALLSAAELPSDDIAAARRHLALFLDRWQASELPAQLATRVDAMQARLAAGT